MMSNTLFTWPSDGKEFTQMLMAYLLETVLWLIVIVFFVSLHNLDSYYFF